MMNHTDTTTSTADVLAAMFTENTGRHMLDSGGAYGRNFERNAGREFLNEPTASFDICRDVWYVQRSTFHFLNERLEFDAERQAEFDKVAETMPDDSWPAVIDAYISERYDGADVLSINTYNHDNVLDQTLQYWQVSERGEAIYPDFVILQVHGGCDVRGGYTAPKLFVPTGGSEVGLLDDNDIWVSCEGVNPPQTETLPGFPDAERVIHSWSSDDGGYNWYASDAEADLTNETMTDDGVPACPCCGAALQVYAY